MAQLIVGVAGAALGAAIPGVGAAIGWAVGTFVGGMFGPTQKSSGPRLDDLKVTASQYGAGIPYVVAHPRVSGTVIWASDKREIANTQRQGKGGGGAEYTSYTYEIDLLILLSANQILGVRRIWSNGKLVWTRAIESDQDSIDASEDATSWRALRFYTGAEDQLPDPVYEAAVGVGNAPAYRGRGTIMLEGVNLGSSGQLPNFTFEIANSIAETGQVVFSMPYLDTLGYQDVEANPLDYMLINGENGYISPELGYVVGYDAFDSPVCGPIATDGSGVQYSGEKLTLALAGNQVLVIEFGMKLGIHYTHGCGSFPENTARAWALQGFGDDLSISTRAIGADQTVLVITVTAGGVLSDYQEFSLESGVFRVTYDPGAGSISVALKKDVEEQFVPIYSYSQRRLVLAILNVGSIGGGGFAYGYQFSHILGYYPPEVEGVPNVPVPLSDVVRDLCGESGISAGNVDVTELEDQFVHALAVQPASARSVLEQLATAYYFECVESDKLYFRRRGRAPSASIPYGAVNADSLLGISEANDLEIPSQVNVTYFNLSNAYQQGNEMSDRLTTDSTAVGTVQLALGLTPAMAKAIADTSALDQTIAARTISTALDLRYAAVEPTDVLLLSDSAGYQHRVRVVKVGDSEGVRSIECVGDDARVLRELGITSDEYDDDYVVRPLAETDLAVLDIPILRDQDDNAGVYAAGDGKGGTWPGYLLRVDGAEAGSSAYGAQMGAVTEALPDWTSELVDEAHVITVTLNPGDQLASITHEALTSGIDNYAAIGQHGRWEIVQFRSAVLTSPDMYRVSGMRRGLLGTEWARGTHSVGDRFVQLDGNGMLRWVGAATTAGQPRVFEGITMGARVDSATQVVIAPEWEGLRPYAPVNLRLLDVPGGRLLTWDRRSRYVMNWLEGRVLLAEASERYEVDIQNGSGTTTHSVSSPQFLITEDFVSAEVYQISASVGRGRGAEIEA